MKKKNEKQNSTEQRKPNFKLFVILNSPELLKGTIFDNNRLY